MKVQQEWDGVKVEDVKNTVVAAVVGEGSSQHEGQKKKEKKEKAPKPQKAPAAAASLPCFSLFMA